MFAVFVAKGLAQTNVATELNVLCCRVCRRLFWSEPGSRIMMARMDGSERDTLSADRAVLGSDPQALTYRPEGEAQIRHPQMQAHEPPSRPVQQRRQAVWSQVVTL